MEYDLIISLGANCSSSANLRRRGLRRCSFPLDWLYIVDDRPLVWLAEHLKDGLRDFCLRENLVRITPQDAEWSAADSRKFKYIDTESGYRFVHLFRRPVEESGEYDRVIPVFRKRIARMLELIGRSHTVLLLLATGKPIRDDVLLMVKSAFEARYPGVRFDLRFLKFEDALFNEVRCSERSPASGILVTEFPRAINEYDFSQTNFEWSFLDDIRLTARVVRPGVREKLEAWARDAVRWIRRLRNGRLL